MQQLWQRNIDWDEPLTTVAEEEWLSIASDIQDAVSMSFTQQYLIMSSLIQPTQLYIFADASLKAYGAVAFISNGNQVSFVMAKNRVAPLKQLSLPTLELMAALIAARLSKFIRDVLHSINLSLHLWTDSQIVL